MMGLGPYRPIKDIEQALDRGKLDMAIAAARDAACEYGQLPLEVALRFLPVVAQQRPGAYDGWALRWLARWSTEAAGASIERAAEVAAALADLPSEPVESWETIRRVL